MNIQQNTIYIAYAQDVVKRLPLSISHILTEAGYNATLQPSQASRFQPPSQQVLDQIAHHEYFLLLLTPASIRHSFGSCVTYLTYEIQHAIEIKKDFLIVLAYGTIETHLDRWWIKSHLPNSFRSFELKSENAEELVTMLDALLGLVSTSKILKLDRQLATTNLWLPSYLKVEALVDAGLSEDYDALVDNRRSKAITFYNKALSIDKDYAEAFFRRAELNYRDRIKNGMSYSEILSDCDSSIQLQFSEAKYYHLRGHIQRDLQNFVEALKNYTEAVQLAPDVAYHYTSRAYLYHIMKEFDQAIVDYTAATKLDPHNASIWFSLSDSHMQKHNYQAALDAINIATLEIDGIFIEDFCIWIQGILRKPKLTGVNRLKFQDRPKRCMG
jgi:tetratricopeptide (TPR) repeat protein